LATDGAKTAKMKVT